MSPANNDSFTFPIWIPLISCLIAVTKISNTILNKSGESGHSCLVSDVRGDAFSFSLLVQFSSVTQLCLTLCDPMNRSMPGLPVHYQLLESTQTQVHRVSDSIQPSHPLSSPSPPAFNLSQLRVFSNESALHIRWPKRLSFSISPSNEHSGLISFRIDWLDLLAFKGLSRVFSNTTVQKHQFFGAQLSL